MPELATPLPAHRPELLIRPLSDEGRYVVKDPRSGEFFQLGEAEHFLLMQFDGQRTIDEIRAAFAEQFGEPLSEDDLGEFIELARSQGLLQLASPVASAPGSPARQSLLHWRKSLWDPDRFFTWLAPRIGFFWTRAFLLFSAGCILVAALLVWANRQELAGSFTHAFRWQSVVLVWLTLLLIGILHECAHGLTCKHYGGEVHEIGFLLLYFIPCFYCNVSDAWLFREKSKRLWVTFAGGWFELFLWALAVFVWRLTLPGTLVNHLAFVVLSLCGIQTLFNFNPLLKLDGYYLLSDWLETPNLRQQALDAFKARVRWLFWRAPRPERVRRGKLLVQFGLATWLYSAVFLVTLLWGLFMWLGSRGSWLGIACVAFLGLVILRGPFRGFVAGEFSNRIVQRYRRTAAWLLLGGLGVALCWIQIEDWSSGTFQARAAVRVELRAPVAGFLRDIYFEEGDRVNAETVVTRLDIPDLASRLAQKHAERREVRAQLALLRMGTRPEELAEYRQRTQRAKDWHDRAKQDLAQQQKALAEDLVCLDHHITACRAELAVARAKLERDRNLLVRHAGSRQECEIAERDVQVCRAKLDKSEAEKRARQAHGTLLAEAELARRYREWADARGTLTLLEAGSRPEQLEAARANLDKLLEEERYLEDLRGQQEVSSPVTGLVSTPRLKEKAGQFVREGDLICVVENPADVVVEIAVAEQESERIEVGQQVALKARALPFTTLPATVVRIAPNTADSSSQSTVTVHARLTQPQPALRPGATGCARIYTGARPIGEILVHRVLRFLRTEFWW
jgi:multidrug efflux pump subunit AcrA (membrane-fusion protein)